MDVCHLSVAQDKPNVFKGSQPAHSVQVQFRIIPKASPEEVDMNDRQVIYMTVRGLAPYTEYQVSVAAVSSSTCVGLGDLSGNTTIKTSRATPPGPVESVPNVQSTDGSGVTLSWEAPKENGGHPVETYYIVATPILPKTFLFFFKL